jgi:peptidoglycan/LPS O-acetylase OafA/YrhL
MVGAPVARADQLPELTALRFFAAVFVLGYHLHMADIGMEAIDFGLFRRGDLGVDLFFILSGFIIAHVYGGAISEGRFSFVDFLRKRFARLYPVHILTTAMAVALYVVGDYLGMLDAGGGMVWGDLIWSVLLLQAWGLADGLSWNTVSWSVSAEFFAYVTFPLSCLLLLRLPALTGLAVSVSLLVVAPMFSMQLFGRPFEALTAPYGFYRIFFQFVFGISLWRLFATYRPAPRIASTAAVASLLASLALMTTDAPTIYCRLTFGLAILTLAYVSTGDTKIIGHPALTYLGEISYSTYLIHWLILEVMVGVSRSLISGSPMAIALFVALYVAAVYVASVILYEWVERPCRKLILTATDRRRVADRT